MHVFCFKMLEGDCFDGKRVTDGSDRNRNHLFMRFKLLNGHCWFLVAHLVRGCNLCNPPVLPVPRAGQTGRRPSADFAKPRQFGGDRQSSGAAGGGRASLPRGSKEEPGSQSSKISMGLWVVDLEPHLSGHSLRRSLMTGTGAAMFLRYF